MRRLLVLVSLLLVAAVCAPPEAHEYLTQGTNYTFEQREHIDYALVIDRSGSMREGGRLEEAKEAAEAFAEQLALGDQAAVIGFDSRAHTYTSFSPQKRVIEGALQRIEIGDFTQYQAGIRQAVNEFAAHSHQGHKVLVLMSDGKPDDDPSVLEGVVQEAISQDVCLYTIAYAEEANEQAQQVLRGIADQSLEATGCGGFFRAQQDSYDLRRIYTQIYDETASENAFDVNVQVSTQQRVTLMAQAVSRYNQRPVFSRACFSPDVEFVITRDEQVVFEQRSAQTQASTLLPAGEYEYYVSVRESCGGECSLTGSTSGSFVVSEKDAVCTADLKTVSSLLRSTQQSEVRITDDGFSPRTISSDGVVTWVNDDSSAHRVIGISEQFRSPLLEPGDRWSYTFGPGEHTYVDSRQSVQGVISREPEPEGEALDVILVLDNSGSMAGMPLDSAKAAADTLISLLRPVDRASLIVFSDQARLVQPLTSNKESLRAGVNSVLSSRSTYYVEALRLMGAEVRKARGSREQVVIFLSDGVPNDEGGERAVMDALEKSLGPACLYTIGYGDQGVDATQLLTRMSSFAQEQNDCGLFYFSSAEEQSLSRIFGEVYALSADQDLEFFDVRMPARTDTDFVVSTRLLSSHNGVEVPSVHPAGCVPAAQVTAVFGNQRFSLLWNGSRYVGNVSLAPGSYTGSLTASVTAYNSSGSLIVGAQPVDVWVRGGLSWLLWAGGLALVIAWAKVFISRRRRREYEL